MIDIFFLWTYFLFSFCRTSIRFLRTDGLRFLCLADEDEDKRSNSKRPSM